MSQLRLRVIETNLFDKKVKEQITLLGTSNSLSEFRTTPITLPPFLNKHNGSHLELKIRPHFTFFSWRSVWTVSFFPLIYLPSKKDLPTCDRL